MPIYKNDDVKYVMVDGKLLCQTCFINTNEGNETRATNETARSHHDDYTDALTFVTELDDDHWYVCDECGYVLNFDNP